MIEAIFHKKTLLDVRPLVVFGLLCVVLEHVVDFAPHFDVSSVSLTHDDVLQPSHNMVGDVSDSLSKACLELTTSTGRVPSSVGLTVALYLFGPSVESRILTHTWRNRINGTVCELNLHGGNAF